MFAVSLAGIEVARLHCFMLGMRWDWGRSQRIVGRFHGQQLSLELREEGSMREASRVLLLAVQPMDNECIRQSHVE